MLSPIPRILSPDKDLSYLIHCLNCWNWCLFHVKEINKCLNIFWLLLPFQELTKLCETLDEKKADKEYVDVEVDVVSISFSQIRWPLAYIKVPFTLNFFQFKACGVSVRPIWLLYQKGNDNEYSSSPTLKLHNNNDYMCVSCPFCGCV